MAIRLFEDKDHAAMYQKYRISPSEELIGEILDFLGKKMEKPFRLAVDVGCGSGQGTVHLAPHFRQVIGTDISPAQLEMARVHGSAPNISYRQCPAEELPFADASVDLVTTMSAAHWFDRPRFIQEALRVLRPGGCLAALNYTMDMELYHGDHSQELNRVCKEFYSALLPYRCPCLASSSVLLYKEMFDSVPYPEKEWHDVALVKQTVPVSGFVRMVETFSTYQALLQKDPEKAKRLSHDTTDRLLSVMGASSPDAEVIMAVKFLYFLARTPTED